MKNSLLGALPVMALMLWTSAAAAQAGAGLDAPRLEATSPGGAPAQQPGWAQVPAPVPSTSPGAGAPRTLSPNGPLILRLREDLVRERAELASIDVGVPVAFFIGGLVATGVGGIMAFSGFSLASADAGIGGLIAAGAGLITWVTSLIIWRVQARQRRTHADRIESTENELRVLLGAPPGLRF